MVAPEHAESVTLVGCINAVGNSIPPMVIFKCKRLKEEFKNNLPPDSLVTMSPKDYMTTELSDGSGEKKRSFESHWDQEVLRYWDLHPDRRLTKTRFNVIFSKVWPKCTTLENIISGFRSTGIFPYDATAVPEAAFAPACRQNGHILMIWMSSSKKKAIYRLLNCST
ncbi:hypothetical protein MML48_3g00018754 [Holotrichia oblita]|uniref:Uncharacterized protein n=1 Tax=Holotrichia oblita TaxID=644536 RepID=A0ACB9TH12_HOLOL|nr:hypothetical protein MML48_3g00018754 [Holotrichia oblita]